ncbi:MAG: GNAT family N-acetyltransferase [Magnetococcales bacterium]|nr:GNAT family N-acetyltransferase [Magnetococcales bacterium]
MNIRPATIEDAAVIVAMIRRLAEFERSLETVAVTEEVVRRDFFRENAPLTVLLAEEDGIVHGMVTLLHAYSSWAGAPTLTVHDFHVNAGMRGRGIGKAMLAEVTRLALEKGCCRLDVNVLSWNEAARSFYQAHGFSPLHDWLLYRLDAKR